MRCVYDACDVCVRVCAVCDVCVNALMYVRVYLEIYVRRGEVGWSGGQIK